MRRRLGILISEFRIGLGLAEYDRQHRDALTALPWEVSESRRHHVSIDSSSFFLEVLCLVVMRFKIRGVGYRVRAEDEMSAARRG